MWPPTCIGIIALVFFVIRFSMLFGFIFKSLFISANFGFAPVCRIALIVIIHVKGVVITSSPGPISRDLRAKYNALLPEPRPTTCFLFKCLEILFSNSFTSGPLIILPCFV